MKRFASVLLVCGLILSLYGCGEDMNYPESESLPESSESAPQIVSQDELKLGIGIISKTDGSLPADEENSGRFKTSTIICAVEVDSEGVIRNIKFDTVKTDFPFDNKGLFTEDITSPVRTMREMGFDVGLSETSQTKNEWFQQMDIFQNWIIGKKAVDVLNMELDENFIPASPELSGRMDIAVSDFLTALNKAYSDAL